MPDPLFDDPRLAEVYDAFDGPRADLDHYLVLARGLGATSMLDIGCGTGTLALLAAAEGIAVTGVDPAAASLDVARRKPGSDRVVWCHGDATDAPRTPVDLAVMTGNVAQVFLTDADWLATLVAVHERLHDDGRLVFETRRPEARVWEQWADPYETSRHVPGVGTVRQARTLLEVALPLVSFRWTYAFPDGSTAASDSTLRFRTDEENRESLRQSGFDVIEVRDAPDRPGLERVYVAAPAGSA